MLQRAWLWLIGPPPLDGRGRRVHVTFLGGYPAALWSKIYKLPPDVHRRVRARCQNARMVWTAPAATFAAVVVTPWIVLAFVNVGPPVGRTGWHWWYLVPRLLGQILSLVGIIWYGSRITARSRIDAFLEESICPACRYPIGGVPVADDGCTVCPECGAAWRLSGLKPGPMEELIVALADAGDSAAEITRRVGTPEAVVERMLARRSSRADEKGKSGSVPR